MSTSFLLSLAALVTLGGADMVSVYIRHLLVQLETPDAIRGRVSAVNAVFIGASNELGEFESGLTAAWWGLMPAVVVGGLASVAIAGLWMRWFPDAAAHRPLSGSGTAVLLTGRGHGCISIQYAPWDCDKARGAVSNRTGRFEALAVEAVDDGWGIADEPLPPLADDRAARAAAPASSRATTLPTSRSTSRSTRTAAASTAASTATPGRATRT